ncbi:MAG: NADH-quinone oxidoreductase subunit M, partial [Planctomycetia bacterium]|nr:NADH-quinone oxidoreductase subunit M [Planctomycetia bacterium]
MDNTYLVVLSLVVFLPTIGALLLTLLPRDATEGIRRTALLVTGVTFLLTVWMALPGNAPGQFSMAEGTVRNMQGVFNIPWIKSLGIHYAMGMDGISFPLVLLTSFISMLGMGASWSITKNVKAYCILFLLLETGMLGVFLALDFFLFFVFWEVMLLPMYFLIGVWGGPRREYAAIKFFLYTMLGGVLMLIAILMLYYTSDLTKLKPEHLVAAHVNQTTAEAQKFLEQADGTPVHTFNILALQQMGQHTNLFTQPLPIGHTVQWWAFLLLFIGFAIKVPSVPLHTWLPDAHVEAPTPISMILAGVLLKMGGYGIIRICYPICPAAGYDLAWLVCTIGVVSMLYGAF